MIIFDNKIIIIKTLLIIKKIIKSVVRANPFPVRVFIVKQQISILILFLKGSHHNTAQGYIYKFPHKQLAILSCYWNHRCLHIVSRSDLLWQIPVEWKYKLEQRIEIGFICKIGLLKQYHSHTKIQNCPPNPFVIFKENPVKTTAH